MVTAIILSLAILTVALIAGVFVVALVELNEIDEFAGESGRDAVKANRRSSASHPVSAD